jgi:hypothetical protein
MPNVSNDFWLYFRKEFLFLFAFETCYSCGKAKELSYSFFCLARNVMLKFVLIWAIRLSFFNNV